MRDRLYRSRTDRMIWGVCGGLGEYLDMDSTIIRVLMVLLAFANGIGILAYLILTLIVPLEDSKAAEIKETLRENVEEMKQTAKGLGQELRSTFGEQEVEERGKIQRRRRNFLGIILIVIGLLFLGANFDLWWFSWGRLWPLLIVIAGLLLILSARRRYRG